MGVAGIVSFFALCLPRIGFDESESTHNMNIQNLVTLELDCNVFHV